MASFYRRHACIVLVAFLTPLVVANAIGEKPSSSSETSAHSLRLAGLTLAVKSVVLSSVQRGTIEKLAVQEGDFVRQGDLTFALNSNVQRAAMALVRALAESTVELDLAKTQCADARRRFERVKRLRSEGVAHLEEYDEAENKLAQAEIEVRLAEFALSQAKRQLAFDEARLAERTVCSPINAYVVEVLKREGESVDEVDAVLRLVQIEPLLVQVDCPIEWAGRVGIGDEADVELSVLKSTTRVGKVIFASKLGDAASHTFRVKLELANPEHDWIAGMKVWVRFRGESLAQRGPSKSSSGDS